MYVESGEHLKSGGVQSEDGHRGDMEIGWGEIRDHMVFKAKARAKTSHRQQWRERETHLEPWWLWMESWWPG